jgi:putative salt-induced outer membrane protein YdiY
VAYKHLFGTTAFFTENLEWLANLEDSQDQRVNSETAFTAPISRQVALKASYVIRYDKQPEPGFETTYRIFTTGVQIVF